MHGINLRLLMVGCMLYLAVAYDKRVSGVGRGRTGANAQTSSMTSTFDRFNIALAIQSNCFSLERVEN